MGQTVTVSYVTISVVYTSPAVAREARAKMEAKTAFIMTWIRAIERMQRYEIYGEHLDHWIKRLSSCRLTKVLSNLSEGVTPR